MLAARASVASTAGLAMAASVARCLAMTASVAPTASCASSRRRCSSSRGVKPSPSASARTFSPMRSSLMVVRAMEYRPAPGRVARACAARSAYTHAVASAAEGTSKSSVAPVPPTGDRGALAPSSTAPARTMTVKQWAASRRAPRPSVAR